MCIIPKNATRLPSAKVRVKRNVQYREALLTFVICTLTELQDGLLSLFLCRPALSNRNDIRSCRHCCFALTCLLHGYKLEATITYGGQTRQEVIDQVDQLFSCKRRLTL